MWLTSCTAERSSCAKVGLMKKYSTVRLYRAVTSSTGDATAKG